jgi:S-formylglutathione hydrolase FrmB
MFVFPFATYRPSTDNSQGYDHSYFFISTFGEDHVKHAAKALGLL